MAITGQNYRHSTLPSKTGHRFSKEALQILKRWLALHSRYPYPAEQEKELLQRQTGLTKTQVSNWFTNTRRKRRAQPQRNPFSHTDNTQTGPIDISRRPGTPAVDSNTNQLQRWVDSPPENEPASVTAIARAVASSWDIYCVFCGMFDPDDGHLETHNHTACKVRPVEDKSFYRKDHINQHLKLVHNAQFIDWSMKGWKVTTSEIRSRCGFCGIIMNSWPARVDHLAEHFKNGSTMADWKGDWGFEASILDMLESSIPPYLIEMERTSTFPFTATSAPADSPRSAYELITLELAYFIVNYKEEIGDLPTDEEMRLEACRVIFASEASSRRGISTESSWLRDLLMGDQEIAKEAQFAPIRHGAENRLCALKINGKDNLFEQCPLEMQLKEFIQTKDLLGIHMTDDELQEECCYIIGNVQELPIPHYDFIADWLIRLVMSSAEWLVDFRHRAHLQRTQHSDGPLSRHWGLEGTQINAEDYHTRDGSTRASTLRPAHSRSLRDTPRVASAPRARTTVLGAQPQQSEGLDSRVRSRRSPGAFEDMMRKTFFMNDSNCYRRLAQELTRFVMATMSPNNPNQHVPSDAEIQHQARWILFESDDAWNQTAADNDEWLQRFKRDVGILAGPGLDRGQGAQ
ncbi:uncharacterized protein NECHADRAFT_51835 [Fusarium vanettenii 77-13-4]|uniref:Homeobox domain-containing protein n=1 Tax=Fusarium vanettenii (strain ATCC MYA-4622 / CBS 123669 / FGSC 9596 / NRRL 45880 / 77-13-4) TaxID=660122 RepID=C7ZH23_FUSV7|nr:uncharacterized protein NECHADRAFT_51835 [Fusarium vanettenii 77-13-4]EEU36737.1 hypothetical protein NECHADRAFT_51835 [Fusarium vanettenii 77-13-4]